jgi:hypothetical protein
MIWKLLLTALTVLIAYQAIRGRLGPRPGPAAEPAGQPLYLGAVRLAAYGLVGLALVGSGLYLLDDWRSGRQVMRVEVVNAATGAVSPYEARRRDIEGRAFRTLDGRQVRLAEVERMIVVETRSP